MPVTWLKKIEIYKNVGTACFYSSVREENLWLECLIFCVETHKEKNSFWNNAELIHGKCKKQTETKPFFFSFFYMSSSLKSQPIITIAITKLKTKWVHWNGNSHHRPATPNRFTPVYRLLGRLSGILWSSFWAVTLSGVKRSGSWSLSNQVP